MQRGGEGVREKESGERESGSKLQERSNTLHRKAH